MRLKLLPFRYSGTLGGFDDGPLLEFIRDKEVLSFREHFFRVNDVPHLVCVVTYQEPVVGAEHLASAFSPASKRTGRDDPARELTEEDRVLFNTLREWRSRRAREEGVPPYVILTNRELLEVVKKKPESPTALGNLDGIGAQKVKRYGKAILEELNGRRRESEPAATQAAEGQEGVS